MERAKREKGAPEFQGQTAPRGDWNIDVVVHRHPLIDEESAMDDGEWRLAGRMDEKLKDAVLRWR